MSGQPDISVIMAAWHAADFIALAIRSVLSQTGVSLELIVVDDASTDGTAETALEAGGGDPRLRVERMASNGGPSSARNRAIDLAAGRYLAVVDSDDSLEPGRLERLVAFADDTSADIVADNMNRIGKLGAPGSSGTPFLSEVELLAPRRVSLADYLSPESERRYGENLGYLKPLFRSATIREIGLRYDTRLRNSEDFYLVAGLLAEGAQMRLHPSRGYNYLVRPGSISHRLTPELTGAILAANESFAKQYAHRFDALARAAFNRRTRDLRNMHSFERVIAALKSRSAVGVASALGARPAAVAHIIFRLSAIAAGKLKRSSRGQNRTEMIQNASDQTAAQ